MLLASFKKAMKALSNGTKIIRIEEVPKNENDEVKQCCYRYFLSKLKTSESHQIEK
jgi:hypothetical protein